MHEARQWLRISINLMRGGTEHPPEDDQWLNFNKELRDYLSGMNEENQKLRKRIEGLMAQIRNQKRAYKDVQRDRTESTNESS